MSIHLDIVKRRLAAYEDAIKALAGYKFWMFGYHASAWVKYNQLLKDTPWHTGNPFKSLVDAARELKKPMDTGTDESPAGARIHPR